jgi:cell division protein FtsI/penicillin-binding protein 2
MAKKQHRLIIPLEPKRGRILDRKGRELAATVKSPSVYASPRLMDNAAKGMLARQLAGILGLDPAWLRARLARDKAFVWVKRKVTDREAEEVRKLAHPAIGLQDEFKRFYPHGQEHAHVLGFCNIDQRGLEGLELAYDEALKGEKGWRHAQRDALGREILALEEKEIPPRHGHDLMLHLDHFIQHAVERELDRAFVKWQAKGACAIVMEPDTGRIVAMASRPSFDPNDYKNSTIDSRRNRCVTDFYEPGSIFKVITIAAALNEEKVKLEDTFDCERGTWHVSRSRVIHDVHPYGELDLPHILIKSSNIGTVKVAKRIGEKLLYDYIRRFGFGELTRVEFPGEVEGIVHPLDRWSKISITSIPYGQEVAATALQMLRALSMVANGGRWVDPRVVKEIRDEFGVVFHREAPFAKRRVLRPDVAEHVRDMLVQAVEEGTGKAARIPWVRVAGKTGTAQKLNPGGGYSHTNFIGSFMGFAPADHPLLAMIVMLDDPHPSYYGGTVAAPVFKAVMEDALLYLGYVPRSLDGAGMEQPIHPAQSVAAPSSTALAR